MIGRIFKENVRAIFTIVKMRHGCSYYL